MSEMEEDLGMELIRQSAALNGVAVCAQAIAKSMENGDISIRSGAAAIAFLGENVMHVSAALMRIQEKIQ